MIKSTAQKKERLFPAAAPEAVRPGLAHAPMHFGEYLQANFPGLPLPTDRAAISVPVLNYDRALILAGFFQKQNGVNAPLEDIPVAKTGSKVTFEPSQDGKLVFANPAFTKSEKAARLTLDYIECADFGGRLEVEHFIREGHGLGTSTSDVVGTIRAVADAFHRQLSNTEVAALAQKAEGACDSIMFEKAGLFITTRCEFLEFYDVPFPRTLILGLEFGDEGNGVDTISLPAKDYTAEELQKIDLLRKTARRAFADQDTKLIGKIATESARLNQRFIPKPHLEDVIRIAGKAGMDGILCAHSGTALGVFHGLNSQPDAAKIRTLLKDMESIGARSVLRFYSA